MPSTRDLLVNYWLYLGSNTSRSPPPKRLNPSTTRQMTAHLARENLRGSETALEGDAGFFHAFTGNNKGRLTYFTSPVSYVR
jgi:hypothetical protein